jgi:uncharacterized sulfatase
VVLLLVAACDTGPTRPDAPNLVLVIGDDVGYRDFGFMGSPIVQTPNLDRLAAEGTVLSHGFASASICRPAMRTLLTGLHPHQWDFRVLRLAQRGVRRPDAEQIRDFATLPRMLAERGYASFEGGKFWEADFAVAGFHDGMQRPGDDPSWGGAGRGLGREPLDPVAAFLDGRGDRPFFLWFAPMLPHLPHDAPEAFRRPYEGRGFSPAAVRYYANVTRFDAVVGELLDLLDARGLLRDTLVVYVSDNGWDQGPGDPQRRSKLGIHDGPRGKRTLYELGLRTPIVFRWPGQVPMGEVRGELVSTVDLFATLVDYAGARMPGGRAGRSLRGLLEGRGGWTRDAVIGEMGQPRAGEGTRPLEGRSGFVRTADWHYIWHEGGGREELYDVRTDPEQRRDVGGAHPAVTAELRARIRRWRVAMRRPFEAP